MSDAQARVDHADAQAAAVSPVEALRRSGRDSRDRWQQAANRARGDLEAASGTAADLRAQAQRLAAAAAAHRSWTHGEGWRTSRVADARIELDRHWARTVAISLSPKATRSRSAPTGRAPRASRSTQGFAALTPVSQRTVAPNSTTPNKPSTTPRRSSDTPARSALTPPEDSKRPNRGASGGARRRPSQAQHKDVTAADHAVDRTTDDTARAQGKVDVEQAAVAARAHAETAAAHRRRRRRRRRLHTVTQAVDTTRPGRIEAAAAAGRPDGAGLRDLLGDPPADVHGRNPWRALAQHVDTIIDHPPAANAEQYLDRLVRTALDRDPCTAHEVKATVERAVQSARSRRADTPQRGLAVRLDASGWPKCSPRTPATRPWPRHRPLGPDQRTQRSPSRRRGHPQKPDPSSPPGARRS